jgi:hypothetical protein
MEKVATIKKYPQNLSTVVATFMVATYGSTYKHASHPRENWSFCLFSLDVPDIFANTANLKGTLKPLIITSTNSVNTHHFSGLCIHYEFSRHCINCCLLTVKEQQHQYWSAKAKNSIKAPLTTSSVKRDISKEQPDEAKYKDPPNLYYNVQQQEHAKEANHVPGENKWKKNALGESKIASNSEWLIRCFCG